MSDYGDEYSDYGEDWFYVEDEYMAADDLAEHAVASPPPMNYVDDDMQPDWDRFDYFNDLEYASDGYDDATFLPHDATNAKVGQKRKRVFKSSRSKKKQKMTEDAGLADVSVVAPSPIVWRSRYDREPKKRFLDSDAPSYALLKNWREDLADTPSWARGSPPANSPSEPSSKVQATFASDLLSPTSELLDDVALVDDDDPEDDGGGAMDISQDALMAALQRQLAAAGGPLSGMDPQQLLQFAMRMATNKDAGDDIAGEMADAMLGGEEEEDDEDTEENLLSWVAKQRNASKNPTAPEPRSPDATRDRKRPPTPPSSEANRSAKAADEDVKPRELKSKTWTTKEVRPASNSKRKADDDGGAESSTKAAKKRTKTSFDAPTAASQARTAPARTTRSTRAKR